MTKSEDQTTLTPTLPQPAYLLHEKSQTRFDFPMGKSFLYIGKTNEHIPVQIELSGLPNAHIVSRVHGIIHVEADGYYLEDADSLNGTAINGQPLKPGIQGRQKLQSGDRITLGKTHTLELRFSLVD